MLLNNKYLLRSDPNCSDILMKLYDISGKLFLIFSKLFDIFWESVFHFGTSGLGLRFWERVLLRFAGQRSRKWLLVALSITTFAC